MVLSEADIGILRERMATDPDFRFDPQRDLPQGEDSTLTALVEKFPYKTGVFGLIFRGNKSGNYEIFLVRRNDIKIGDKYMLNLPGGGIEEGEYWIDAVKREVEEEVGLKVENVATIGFVHADGDQEGRVPAEERQDFFGGVICRVVGGELRLSDEASEVLWVPVSDLLSGQVLELYSKHLSLIRIAYDNEFDMIKRSIDDN